MPQKEVRIINRNTGDVRFVSKETSENVAIMQQLGFEIEQIDEDLIQIDAPEQPAQYAPEQPAQYEPVQDPYEALTAASTEQTEAIVKTRKPRQPKQ